MTQVTVRVNDEGIQNLADLITDWLKKSGKCSQKRKAHKVPSSLDLLEPEGPEPLCFQPNTSQRNRWVTKCFLFFIASPLAYNQKHKLKAGVVLQGSAVRATCQDHCGEGVKNLFRHPRRLPQHKNFRPRGPSIPLLDTVLSPQPINACQLEFNRCQLCCFIIIIIFINLCNMLCRIFESPVLFVH